MRPGQAKGPSVGPLAGSKAFPFSAETPKYLLVGSYQVGANGIIGSSDGISWYGTLSLQYPPRRIFSRDGQITACARQYVYGFQDPRNIQLNFSGSIAEETKGPVLRFAGNDYLLENGYFPILGRYSTAYMVEENTNPYKYIQGAASGIYGWIVDTNGSHRSTSNQGVTWGGNFTPGYGSLACFRTNTRWGLIDTASTSRIISTTDTVPNSGSTWQITGTVNDKPTPASAMFAYNGSIGIINTSVSGVILRTTDDGITFARYSLPVAGTIGSVKYIDGTFYALMVDGSSASRLYASLDGISWNLVLSIPLFFGYDFLVTK